MQRNRSPALDLERLRGISTTVLICLVLIAHRIHSMKVIINATKQGTEVTACCGGHVQIDETHEFRLCRRILLQR